MIMVAFSGAQGPSGVLHWEGMHFLNVPNYFVYVYAVELRAECLSKK